VLNIDGDWFTVYHPLTEAVCRLPVAWITRVLPRPTNGSTKEAGA
jgi:hypothetical protein